MLFLLKKTHQFQALGIPVYLGGMSRGLLGAHCRLQMRQERKEALREADLVILAGLNEHFGIFPILNCFIIKALCATSDSVMGGCSPQNRE